MTDSISTQVVELVERLRNGSDDHNTSMALRREAAKALTASLAREEAARRETVKVAELAKPYIQNVVWSCEGIKGDPSVDGVRNDLATIDAIRSRTADTEGGR
jgi:hypothetical protein